MIHLLRYCVRQPPTVSTKNTLRLCVFASLRLIFSDDELNDIPGNDSSPPVLRETPTRCLYKKFWRLSVNSYFPAISMNIAFWALTTSLTSMDS
jgi:hypothetical protein